MSNPACLPSPAFVNHRIAVRLLSCTAVVLHQSGMATVGPPLAPWQCSPLPPPPTPRNAKPSPFPHLGDAILYD